MIAGEQPSIANYCGRCIGIAVVAGHHRCAAHGDLAGSAIGKLIAGVVENRDLVSFERASAIRGGDDLRAIGRFARNSFGRQSAMIDILVSRLEAVRRKRDRQSVLRHPICVHERAPLETGRREFLGECVERLSLDRFRAAAGDAPLRQIERLDILRPHA